MKRAIFVLAGLILAFSLCAVGAAESYTVSNESKEAVQGAAQAWLRLIDQKDYAASYETASAYFKAMVTKEQWLAQAGVARKPLGGLVSRKLREHQYAATLPGAPDGEYCVLTFEAALSRKAKATETVTMIKEQDGQWRAAGYFVR